MSEDITQDPEYIKGYEQGIEQWRSNHSPWRKGFIVGLHALDTPEVVESKAVPGSSRQEDWRQQIEERLSKIEERLRKLEKYTEE